MRFDWGFGILLFRIRGEEGEEEGWMEMGGRKREKRDELKLGYVVFLRSYVFGFFFFFGNRCI